MNYASRTDKPFITTKAISQKTKLTPEAKARRSYIRSHSFSVNINPSTREAKVEVTEN